MRIMNFWEFFRKHKVGIIIFLLALAVRLTLFAVNFNAAQGNFIETVRGGDGYYEISRNLIDGNGFSQEQGPVFSPEPLRPPVWIFFMAIIAKIFGSYVPVFIFEIIIGSLIPVIGMYLAVRVISARHAVFVGLLLALEPVSVLLSIIFITETSFTFLFLLFVVFLFRYIGSQTTRHIVWAGVFLGLAILVKPTIQFFTFLVPVALFLIFKKKKSFPPILYKHCAYFFLVSVLILTPWFYRNYKEFGAVGLSAQPAFNLYLVLVPSVLSIDNGTSYESEFKVVFDAVNSGGGGITLANSSYYIKEAFNIIKSHKVAFAESLATSVITFFTHDGMLTVLAYAGQTIPNMLSKPALLLLLTNPAELARGVFFYWNSPVILVFFGRLFWVAVTLLFFAGAWLYLRREKFSPFVCVALGVVAYFALLTTANGFGMNARFRVPVNVFIFTFAIYGFSILWGVIKGRLFAKHEKTFDHHSDI